MQRVWEDTSEGTMGDIPDKVIVEEDILDMVEEDILDKVEEDNFDKVIVEEDIPDKVEEDNLDKAEEDIPDMVEEDNLDKDLVEEYSDRHIFLFYSNNPLPSLGYFSFSHTVEVVLSY